MAIAMLLFLTVVLLLEAWLIRIGRLQKWPRRYFAASDAPNYIRRGVFGLVPWAGMTLSWALCLVVAPLGHVGEYVALALVFGGFAFLWEGFRWMKRPPEWVKPDWMREAEAAPPDAGDARRGARLVMVPRWQYYGTWALIPLLVVVCLVLGSPGPAITGAGIALVIIASCRPEPRRPPDRHERS